MKKIIIGFLISSCLMLSCSEDTQTKMKGHIPDSEVPMPVKTAFSTKYPGATDVEWEKETEDSKTVYEVEFKFSNQERETTFDENGNLLKEKTD